MRYDNFLERVLRHIKLADRDLAERLVDATLNTLGQKLSDDVAADLGSWLPAALAQPVQRGPHGQAIELGEFFGHIAMTARLKLPEAADLAPGVLATLAESLSDRQLEALRSELPPAWHELLSPARPARAELHRAAGNPRQSSLAAGRPGAERPLAEAGAPSAHSHSIARSADPHAGSTLASAGDRTKPKS